MWDKGGGGWRGGGRDRQAPLLTAESDAIHTTAISY